MLSLDTNKEVFTGVYPRKCCSMVGSGLFGSTFFVISICDFNSKISQKVKLAKENLMTMNVYRPNNICTSC